MKFTDVRTIKTLIKEYGMDSGKSSYGSNKCFMAPSSSSSNKSSSSPTTKKAPQSPTTTGPTKKEQPKILAVRASDVPADAVVKDIEDKPMGKVVSRVGDKPKADALVVDTGKPGQNQYQVLDKNQKVFIDNPEYKEESTATKLISKLKIKNKKVRSIKKILRNSENNEQNETVNAGNGSMNESIFAQFDKLSLEEQLTILERVDSIKLDEVWSKKYKDSINCSNPKGFSQEAHCDGKKKNEDVDVDENLKQWFKDKWVRFGPDGKIKGDCARGDDSEGKPKCLPQSKAHSLGKKGRASAARRKRKEDPNPERKGAAKNVATKKEGLEEKCWKGYRKDGMKTMFGKRYPNCIKNEGQFRADDLEEFKPSNEQLNDIKAKFLPDWDMLDHRELTALYVAPDHRQAQEFAQWINEISEQLDHFAEVTQDVTEITVKTSTFDVNGLTLLDFQLAMQVDHYASEHNIKQASVQGNFGMHEDTSVPFNECPHCRGPIVHESMLNEKQDACYHKVKSRYKVWPSAYASGALVQCRKKGAKNWGNSKKESVDEDNARVARKPGQPANSKKHSDLYTDENPKGTITGLKFATVEDAKASVSKIRNSGRSHAHKIQAAVAMEQRAKVMGKASAAAVYRKYINATKKESVDEDYGRYYCSTDKKWKTRKGPKQQRNIKEGAVPDNRKARILNKIMARPLLASDLGAQMEAFFAIPDPRMVNEFRKQRAIAGDNIDLRPVVKGFIESVLHPDLQKQVNVSESVINEYDDLGKEKAVIIKTVSGLDAADKEQASILDRIYKILNSGQISSNIDVAFTKPLVDENLPEAEKANVRKDMTRIISSLEQDYGSMKKFLDRLEQAGGVVNIAELAKPLNTFEKVFGDDPAIAAFITLANYGVGKKQKGPGEYALACLSNEIKLAEGEGDLQISGIGKTELKAALSSAGGRIGYGGGSQKSKRAVIDKYAKYLPTVLARLNAGAGGSISIRPFIDALNTDLPTNTPFNVQIRKALMSDLLVMDLEKFAAPVADKFSTSMSFDEIETEYLIQNFAWYKDRDDFDALLLIHVPNRKTAMIRNAEDLITFRNSGHANATSISIVPTQAGAGREQWAQLTLNKAKTG